MIVYPDNWRSIGVPITKSDIVKAIQQTISDIDCSNISFSGGVDSCLLLSFMLEKEPFARCFTITNNIEHPDIYYARNAINWFIKRYKAKIDHYVITRPKLDGDELVKAYYSTLQLSFSVKDIIAGDCIDELSCGYYSHQDLKEETYQDFLNRLQSEHLEPLNSNSGDIAVYLPYANHEIINLFYKIPLYNKVTANRRKIIIMELAKGRVPPESIRRKKYGFATNFESKEKHKVTV